MPDKIWLHKDTKYNTGDIVCGYQYEFAEGIEDEGGIENFVEYVSKNAFIDKACNYLFSRMGLFVTFFDDDIVEDIERSEFIKKFRIAMEDKL